MSWLSLLRCVHLCCRIEKCVCVCVCLCVHVCKASVYTQALLVSGDSQQTKQVLNILKKLASKLQVCI